MTLSCRLRILLLCLAAIVSSGCSTDSRPTKKDWEQNVQKILTERKGQFQICGKHLRKAPQAIEVSMTFRLNPTGALETLWLDESAAWDSRFYDCLFNVVDGMNFPAFADDTSLEVQQPLIFRPRI
jgi:hypothetical protein